MKNNLFRVPLILHLESFLKMFLKKAINIPGLKFMYSKKKTFVSIIIKSSFILGKKLKIYHYIVKKNNTIKFCKNQATAKLMGLFTSGPKPLSYIL